MRLPYPIFFPVIVMLMAGCTVPRAAAPVERGLQPAADGSAVAPIEPSLDPVQTGQQLLEAGGRKWLGTPIPVVVQTMTFAEAHKWIPMLSPEGDQFWGPQTPVWFVVFKGRWAPTDPPGPPIGDPGCLLVLFRASDGSLIAAGDSLCPGQQ